jgi:hypothetical protein
MAWSGDCLAAAGLKNDNFSVPEGLEDAARGLTPGDRSRDGPSCRGKVFAQGNYGRSIGLISIHWHV